MKFLEYCNRTLAYSFYAIFLFVPLIFSGDTSELFELNKMWFAYGATAIIAATWGVKMVLAKKVFIQRTPLDIPLMLFLLSQIISTFISLDQSVSWWGYYSRFNGGLLSTICYILLYYAFVSNLKLKHVVTSLKVMLISGLLTALWGFPSHYGYDPTCLVFRGQLDTKCWTDAFQPTVRTFSTLGQPAWFAAFLAALIPVAMAFSLKATKYKVWMYFALAVFFYINLGFTDTRAGFLAFWVGNIVFWAAIYVRHTLKDVISKRMFWRAFGLFNAAFLICTFFFGGPIGTYSRFTLPEMISRSSSAAQQAVTQQTQQVPGTAATTPQQAVAQPQPNITDSSQIRLLVWQGAINAWKNSFLFGTGVETFAFAYYKYKSPAHNLTSEWDYLYNKAHNEYLNYLTTTGIFGLGTYLAFIGLFLFIFGKKVVLQKAKNRRQESDDFEDAGNSLLSISIVSGFTTILISNFFGFSVVIINVFLFLFPVFVLLLNDLTTSKHNFSYSFDEAGSSKEISGVQWALMGTIVLAALWINIGLLIYRSADIEYALGNNLDKTGSFQDAYPHLNNAVQTIPYEAVYQDELSINLAAIAAALYSQKSNAQAAEAANKAIALNDAVIAAHPNNVVYWKNRVRLFYTLASTDQANQARYYQEAMKAIDTARSLAPTDAKIAYNQGVLYGQVGQIDKAISILNDTIKMRNNYSDAYYALGMFYHQAAIDKNGKVVNRDYQQKAIQTYEYLYKNLDPQNKEVQDSLKQWAQE